MNQPNHFDKIFYYICGTSFLILVYVASITFFTIPKENQRFVDIALAFLLGFIAANGSYLTGGNPSAYKKPADAGTTTADISATITTETKDEK